VASAGCTLIRTFRADPISICSGAKATLSWEVTARGLIFSEPPSTVFLVDGAGSVEVAPHGSTKYDLEVRGLISSATRSVLVDVIEEARCAASKPAPPGPSEAPHPR